MQIEENDYVVVSSKFFEKPKLNRHSIGLKLAIAFIFITGCIKIYVR